MTPLRQRMIQDMELAGLQPRTRETYVKSVRDLAAFYHRSPDQMTEEEVRNYFLDLKGKGVARGTFKTSHYGIRFLFCQTLGRDWLLFGKKRSGNRDRNVCLTPFPTWKSAIS